jgi:hypothetical protein
MGSAGSAGSATWSGALGSTIVVVVVVGGSVVVVVAGVVVVVVLVVLVVVAASAAKVAATADQRRSTESPPPLRPARSLRRDADTWTASTRQTQPVCSRPDRASFSVK